MRNELKQIYYLVRHNCMPPEEIPTFLESNTIPEEYKELSRIWLERKYEIHSLTREYDYNTVSLGTVCHPRSMVLNWQLYTDATEQERLPFDVAWHPTESVVSLLETDFAHYTSQENIRLCSHGGVDCFSLETPSVVFNHDPQVGYDGDSALFSRTLQSRILSFTRTVANTQSIFLHYADTITEEIIERFQAILDSFKLNHNLNHKLLLYAVNAEHYQFTYRDIHVCLVPRIDTYPDWWMPHNIFTRNFCDFEYAIVQTLAEIIRSFFVKNKPIQAEPTSVVTADTLDEVLAEKRLLEIANEYVVQEYIQELQTDIAERKAHKASCGTDDTVGAIVMNCNPFTLGHRYLIEYAASRVDSLLIFVVEEDLSFFPFQDRIALVKAGTADLDNVHVVRSGRFIISTLTFPIYFTKENPDLLNFDASTDIAFFGKYIAPSLNIDIRFVGTEPSCPVTRAYNAQMALELPRYGVALEEVPRKEISGRTISASLVRSYLEEGRMEDLKTYVPDTTYAYLKNLQHRTCAPSASAEPIE